MEILSKLQLRSGTKAVFSEFRSARMLSYNKRGALLSGLGEEGDIGGVPYLCSL